MPLRLYDCVDEDGDGVPDCGRGRTFDENGAGMGGFPWQRKPLAPGWYDVPDRQMPPGWWTRGPDAAPVPDPRPAAFTALLDVTLGVEVWTYDERFRALGTRVRNPAPSR